MDVIFKLVIVVGICITSFYGFQWYQGMQAVEESTMEESELFSTHATGKEKLERKKSASSISYKPVMSDEMDKFEKGTEVARLEIPSIDSAYTVYWGADEEALDRGVGMYVSEWTTTPDQKRHTVLSGHRDTVFTELGNLEKGDRLAVQFEKSLYIYEVEKTWITSADDRTVIVDKEKPTLTLTTCYPFEFIGNAPDRYIIESSLVEVKNLKTEKTG